MLVSFGYWSLDRAFPLPSGSSVSVRIPSEIAGNAILAANIIAFASSSNRSLPQSKVKKNPAGKGFSF